MEGQFGQIRFEHIQIHITVFELLHRFLLQFLHPRQEIEQIAWSKESEIEVTRLKSG